MGPFGSLSRVRNPGKFAGAGAARGAAIFNLVAILYFFGAARRGASRRAFKMDHTWVKNNFFSFSDHVQNDTRPCQHAPVFYPHLPLVIKKIFKKNAERLKFRRRRRGAALDLFEIFRRWRGARAGKRRAAPRQGFRTLGIIVIYFLVKVKSLRFIKAGLMSSYGEETSLFIF